MEPSYYLYKMTCDNGGAPCIFGGMLSLAICKPRIRLAAKVDDFIFGFGGKDMGEKLIYISKITKKEPNGKYYENEGYLGRPDRIYEWIGDALQWKSGSLFHEGGSVKDIGLPGKHQAAAVLLSSDFRYFGQNGTCKYKEMFPALEKTIRDLTQGERKNHDHELRRELTELQKYIWQKFSKPVNGKPHQGDHSLDCSECEGAGLLSDFSNCETF